VDGPGTRLRCRGSTPCSLMYHPRRRCSGAAPCAATVAGALCKPAPSQTLRGADANCRFALGGGPACDLFCSCRCDSRKVASPPLQAHVLRQSIFTRPERVAGGSPSDAHGTLLPPGCHQTHAFVHARPAPHAQPDHVLTTTGQCAPPPGPAPQELLPGSVQLAPMRGSGAALKRPVAPFHSHTPSE
jgi:hypothetical protein